MYARIEGGKGCVYAMAKDDKNPLDGFVDTTVYSRQMTNKERKKYGLPLLETKVCKMCGEEKTVEQFSKNKQKKDGLSIYCRSCCKKKYKKSEEVQNEKRL